MDTLKATARERGLWNLFQPHSGWWGDGFSNVDYAPLAEIMGRSPIAPEACNRNAPDTGNMEVLTMFGTPEQQKTWLHPLLEGEIRSAFGMTEPDVASSDATNVSLRIERQGSHYVLNGRKWWTTNAFHKKLRVMIVMGKTDPNASPHRQQSQILVPGRHARADIRTEPQGIRILRQRGTRCSQLRQRPSRSVEPDRRRGRWICNQPGSAGPGSYSPLHADDRCSRTRARVDVQSIARTDNLREATRRAVEHPGLDR